MSSEAKFYPKSNESRREALFMADLVNQSTTTNNPLSTRTKDRLNIIYPQYQNLMSIMAGKKAESSTLVTEKEKLRVKLSMYCSHFFQVLNMCIRRGEFTVAARAYYGLEVENEKLPPLLLQDDVWLWAERLISGEQARVAAGGAAMSRPSAAEVEAIYLAYKPMKNDCSNAKDALDNAQEDVQRLNKEADGVIKKIWNEVEVYYSEQARPSMREHARRWGVVYARKGYKKKVTGTVVDSATGLPLAGAQVKLSTGRKKAVSAADGKFSLSTSLMDEQKLSATLAGYLNYETKVVLHETKDTVCELRMGKV